MMMKFKITIFLPMLFITAALSQPSWKVEAGYSFQVNLKNTSNISRVDANVQMQFAPRSTAVFLVNHATLKQKGYGISSFRYGVLGFGARYHFWNAEKNKLWLQLDIKKYFLINYEKSYFEEVPEVDPEICLNAQYQRALTKRISGGIGLSFSHYLLSNHSFNYATYAGLRASLLFDLEKNK